MGECLSPVESQLWGSTGVDYLPNAIQHLYEAAGWGHQGCGASCHQYADDTQLYISFPPTAGDAALCLQCCLGALLQWMQENGLRLNPDKMEVLRMVPPLLVAWVTPSCLGGGDPCRKEWSSQLGIHLDIF